MVSVIVPDFPVGLPFCAGDLDFDFCGDGFCSTGAIDTPHWGQNTFPSDCGAPHCRQKERGTCDAEALPVDATGGGAAGVGIARKSSPQVGQTSVPAVMARPQDGQLVMLSFDANY
jgi:hypothetical protein